MDCLPIPQFFPNFLLRSKTYLKERPPSANMEFPLSSKLEDVVRLHTRLHSCTVVYSSTRCLAHDVTHAHFTHRFER